MRVFQEMQRLVTEVDELRQRRVRAEKALHAAEALRQVCPYRVCRTRHWPVWDHVG